MRARLALVAVITLGCGDSTELNPAPDGGSDARADALEPAQACAGRRCGEGCSCPSCDGGVGWCSADGFCDRGLTLCGQCQLDSDCPAPPVCYKCPDGSDFCPVAQCRGGICVITEDDCAPSAGYAPCESKACNERCSLCAPDAIDCEEPPGERHCGAGADASCVTRAIVCSE
jgi:hypothetical protein